MKRENTKDIIILSVCKITVNLLNRSITTCAQYRHLFFALNRTFLDLFIAFNNVNEAD